MTVNSAFDLRKVETTKDYSTQIDGSNITYKLGDMLLLNGGGVVCVLSNDGIRGKILSKDESWGTWSSIQTNTNAWYIPTKEEFTEIENNRSIINGSLAKLGYPTLSDRYWPSTNIDATSAYCVEFTRYGLYTLENEKKYNAKIRAITTF